MTANSFNMADNRGIIAILRRYPKQLKLMSTMSVDPSNFSMRSVSFSIVFSTYWQEWQQLVPRSGLGVEL